MTLGLKAVACASSLLAAAASVTGCGSSAETVQGSTATPALVSAAPGGVPFEDALDAALRRNPFLGKVIDIGPILNRLAAGTCSDFAHGMTSEQIVGTRFHDASIDMTSAAFDIAVDSLCPQYREWAGRTR
jgi:hypothetical protein